MAEVPDLHYKMSKKIAQLTKVIYQLNSRNDAQEGEMLALGVRHENEIQYILKDACRRLNEFQEDISAKNDQLKQNKALEEQKELHKQEKEHFVAQYEQLKAKSKSDQHELETKYETQILFITRDLEHIQQQFTQKISDFAKLSDFAQESFHTTIEAVQHSYDIELGKIAEMHANDLHDRIHVEQAKALELIQDHQLKQSQLQQQLTEQEKEFTREKDKLEKQAADQQAQQQAAYEKQLESLQATHLEQNNKLREANQQLASEIMQLKQSLSDATSTTAALQTQMTQERAARSAENSEMSAALALSEQKAKDLTAQCARLTAQLDRLSANYAAIETQSKTEAQTQQDDFISRLQSKAAELLACQNDKKQLETTLQNDIATLNERYNQAMGEAERLQLEKTQLQNQVATSVQKWQQGYALVSQRYQSLEEAANSKLSLLSTRIQQLTQAVVSHAVHAQSLTQQNVHLRQRGLDLSQELTEKGTLITNIQSKIKELQYKYDKLQQQSGVSSEKSTNDLLRAQQELAHHNAELTNLKALLQERDTELFDVKKQASAHRLTIENLTKQLVQQQHEAELQVSTTEATLQGKWAQQMAVSERVLTDKLELLRQDHIILEQQKNEELRLLQANLLNLTQTNTENEVCMKNQLQQIEQLNTLIEQLELSKQQLEINWTNQHKLLTDEATINKQQMEKRYDELLANQQKANLDHLDGKVLEVTSYYDTKITELIAANDQNIIATKAELELQYTSQISKIEKSQQQREAELIKELKNGMNTKFTQLQNERAQEQNSWQLIIESKNEMIRNLENDVEQYKLKSTQYSHDLTTAHNKLSDKNQEMIATRNQLLNEIKETSETITQKYESIVDSVEKNKHLQIQQITDKFNYMQHTLEEKCARLQQQITEAEYRYANRSPREQDLDVIQSLRSEIADNSQLINKLKMDQKHIKLELQNREENLNKIFNKTPQIGVTPIISKSNELNKSTSPKLPPLSARGDKNFKASTYNK